MIPGEPEPLAIGLKKAPLSSQRRGFFWFFTESRGTQISKYL